MTKAVELRVYHLAAAACSRAKDKGDSPIKGLSAVFYREGDAATEYWLWSDVVERIMPTAFDRALKERHDARALFNHDSSLILGRVSAGSVKLSKADQGLEYEIPFDAEDPDHMRVAKKIDRGDVTGSSFAFVATKTTWVEQKQDSGGYIYIRQIEDLDLYDVGPVTYPAYEGTSAVRAKTDFMNRRQVMKQLRQDWDAEEEIKRIYAERDALLVGDDVAVRMARLKASGGLGWFDRAAA